MSEIIVLKSVDDTRRECIQLAAEIRLGIIKRSLEEPDREKDVQKAQEVIAEGEKVTTVKKGEDINKVIDAIEWKENHDPDKKLVSIPGLKKLKGGIY